MNLVIYGKTNLKLHRKWITKGGGGRRKNKGERSVRLQGGSGQEKNGRKEGLPEQVDQLPLNLNLSAGLQSKINLILQFLYLVQGSMF